MEESCQTKRKKKSERELQGSSSNRVKKMNSGGCPGCAFSISKRNEEEMCDIMECTDSRRDGKTVCFKGVKE